MAIPILSTEHVVLTSQTDSFLTEQQIQNVVGNHFTRPTAITRPTVETPDAAHFKDLEALIAYTDQELWRAAEAIGATVAPHTFGLIPVKELARVVRQHNKQSVCEKYNELSFNARSNWDILPANYMLGCEIEIIEPATVVEEGWERWDAIQQGYNKYLSDCRQNGKSALFDLGKYEQFVFGAPRQYGVAATPVNYLVDIEPRFYFPRN